MQNWQRDGSLRRDIPDLVLAADSFVQLCGARVRDRVMLMGRGSVDDAMIRRTVDNAVETFLRAYGTEVSQRLIAN